LQECCFRLTAEDVSIATLESEIALSVRDVFFGSLIATLLGVSLLLQTPHTLLKLVLFKPLFLTAGNRKYTANTVTEPH